MSAFNLFCGTDYLLGHFQFFYFSAKSEKFTIPTYLCRYRYLSTTYFKGSYWQKAVVDDDDDEIILF